MTERDFLNLLKDVLTSDTFVNQPMKVFRARQEVTERIEALAQEELERVDLEVHG